MSKNDVIETQGKVIDLIPGGKFKVEETDTVQDIFNKIKELIN